MDNCDDRGDDFSHGYKGNCSKRLSNVALNFIVQCRQIGNLDDAFARHNQSVPMQPPQVSGNQLTNRTEEGGQLFIVFFQLEAYIVRCSGSAFSQNSLNSSGMNTCKKSVSKSFRMNTCKTKDLKSLYFQHLQKTGGGGGWLWLTAYPMRVRVLRSIATKDLSVHPTKHVCLPRVAFTRGPERPWGVDGPRFPCQPAPNHISQGAACNPAQHIRHVVVPPPNRRNAHANCQRQQSPEQPATVTPRRPQCSHGSRHMLRRKCRPAHPPKMFNEADRRGEWPSPQIAMPHSRHREPRALDRK